MNEPVFVVRGCDFVCLFGGWLACDFRLQRLLFIIRDPFASIWAEYQRRQSIGHVSTLLWEDFDKDQ